MKEKLNINQEIKKIDYIRAIADLSQLTLEDRAYVAGMAKGMLMQRHLKEQRNVSNGTY